MKNKLYATAVFIIFGLFLFINILTLNDGHNWGDDFAQYIHHSINLVEHKPYTSDISLDHWLIYPPGFPLLLSSIIYWVGINLKLLKSLNVLLWALSALVVYGITLDSLDLIWARMLTVWFLTFPFFFFFKQDVLSDIPFMFFVLLSLWALIKSEGYQQRGSNGPGRVLLLLSIVCASYSLLIRWAGISLLLAVVVYFLVVKRDWKKPLGFILGSGVSWVIAWQCGSLFSGYLCKTTDSMQEWFWANYYNVTYNFEMILGFFVTDDKLFSKMTMPISLGLFNTAFGLLLLCIIGLFAYRLYQRKISLIGCFTFFYLMQAFCWPVRGGSRYMLPIIIPIAIYGVKKVKIGFQKVVLFIFLILIAQNIFVIGSNFKFNDDDIYQKESLEMAQWVTIHLKSDERYMFAKPRALWLLTHRVGASYGMYHRDKDLWYKRIKPLHIGYLICDKHFDSIGRLNDFRIRVDEGVLNITVVWENSRYKIFKVS